MPLIPRFCFTVVACACLMACAPGCGGKRNCAVPAAAERARAADRAVARDLRQAVRTRMESRGPDRPLNVLVLSGGGAYGAWGAGVLNGWRDAAGGRPEFDVVTGISTGSLLATFAFLDGPEYDRAMEAAYTTLRTRDVYRKRFILSVPFSNSMYTTGPLEQVIERFVSDDVIRRVGELHATGRRLYVGTVNLDDGKLRIWNMTELANEGRFDEYRRVLLAAASIPVMFPPVMLEGAMHVDGGARAQLFLRRDLVPIVREMKAAMRAAGFAPAVRPGPARPDEDEEDQEDEEPDELDTDGAAAPDPPAVATTAPSGETMPLRVYVLVNGAMGLAPACVNDNILPIALRSAENLVDAGGIGDIYRTKHLSDELGFDFRLCFYDPLDGEYIRVPLHDFQPDSMRRLYDQGVEWGRNNQWMSDVPRFPEDEL